MKKPNQKTMNAVYALLIFSPVFVQAGNMWTTNGNETLTNYNAIRTPPVNEQVIDHSTMTPDQMTSPAMSSPRIYNSDPSLRSKNLYGAPTSQDTATDYNLDTAPDMDR